MITSLKLWLYRTVDLLLNGRSHHLQIDNPQLTNKPYYWCFCSTIGELNACKQLIEQIPNYFQLVIFSDRQVYSDSYLKAFPTAMIVTLQGSSDEAKKLVKRLPPTHVLICEIPLKLHDAPCRLSFDLLHRAKQQGATISLVNGWLYDYTPSCRQDRLEALLFTKAYSNLFDVVTVQSEQVKQKIAPIRASQGAIHVTGNMKLDRLQDQTVSVKDANTERLLAVYKNHQASVFIAGSVSNFDEYMMVIDAYQHAIATEPDCLFILAPRHPENSQHMQFIADYLNKQPCQDVVYRSTIEHPPTALPGLLILDTIGELKAFYSVVDCAYIGINHNVLEPLAFNLPVAVKSNWNKQYPSYPVYQIANATNSLQHVDTAEQLAAFSVGAKQNQDAHLALRQYQGALQNNYNLLQQTW